MHCSVSEDLMPGFLHRNAFPESFPPFQMHSLHSNHRCLFYNFLRHNIKFAIWTIIIVMDCIHNIRQPSPLFSKLLKNLHQDITMLITFQYILTTLKIHLISPTWPVVTCCQAPTCFIARILLFLQLGLTTRLVSVSEVLAVFGFDTCCHFHLDTIYYNQLKIKYNM